MEAISGPNENVYSTSGQICLPNTVIVEGCVISWSGSYSCLDMFHVLLSYAMMGCDLLITFT